MVGHHKKINVQKLPTNVFGNILKKKFEFTEDHNFHWDTVRSCIKAKEFQVVALSIDDELNVLFHIKDRNISDTGVDGIGAAIKIAITEFRETWRP